MNKWKRGIASVLALWIALLPWAALPVTGLAVESREDIAAEFAVLMDADTGQVLFSKRMSDRAYPASTTKILTGLLTMEYGSPADMVVASGAAVDIPYGSTTMGLFEGEEMTVDEAMYAMMLRSANDASNLLGEYVSGSLEEFIKLMNAKAREYGALDSNFANPSGLPAWNHYTTAYDLAVITRAAMDNPDFMHYFGYDAYTMSPTNKEKGERIFTNGQTMLLEDSDYYYPDVIGGKVGYTDESRHTMVTVASRGGRNLICVVLGCGREEKFTDTQALLDYGFGGFRPVTVQGELPEAMRASIVEDGVVVGSARYGSRAEWELLLPNGMSPDAVTVEYVVPDAVSLGEEEQAAYVRFRQQGAVLMPTVFLNVPMEAEIDYFEQPAMAVSGRESQEAWEAGGLLHLALGIAIAALVTTGAVTAAVLTARRRRGRKARFYQREFALK